MRDRAVNIGQRLTTRMPSGEQPGDIRTRHAPKAGLVLLNNQIKRFSHHPPSLPKISSCLSRLHTLKVNSVKYIRIFPAPQRKTRDSKEDPTLTQGTQSKNRFEQRPSQGVLERETLS